MNSALDNAPDHFSEDIFSREDRELRLFWKRLLIAAALVVLAHLLFFGVVAPLIRLTSEIQNRTTVEEISSKDLERLKKQIMKNRQLAPLLKQELHPEYKSKEAPKDAQMMAPFNQVVPEQTVAGPQTDAPLDGGGHPGTRSAEKQTKVQNEKFKQLDLSKLGLGSAVPMPAPPQQEQADSQPGPQGPPGPFRPVGRDDPHMKKGNQNLLNAQENEYYSFFARFEEPIIRNWYYFMRNKEGQLTQEIHAHHYNPGTEVPCTVEFVLDRDGNFHSITVIEPSGLQSFDWAAKTAIQKLGSLPNPPAGVFEGGQYFTYRLQFLLILNEGSAIGAPGLTWY